MISKLSECIAAGLKQSSIIKEDDVELYAYGFYILISKLLFLIIALILGVILNIVFESIVFYVSFSIIRAYAGGVHADKEWKCFLYTSVSIIMCALGIKVLINLKPTVLFAVILMISSLIIIIISPLDTKEKPLSARYKRKAVICLRKRKVLYDFCNSFVKLYTCYLTAFKTWNYESVLCNNDCNIFRIYSVNGWVGSKQRG